MKRGDVSLDDTVAPATENPALDRTTAAGGAQTNPALDRTTAAGGAQTNPALDRTRASDPALDHTSAAGSLSMQTHDEGRRSKPVLADPTGEIEVGARIGRYIVASKLGAGGMGVVLAAYDPELDRKVAIKLVRPGAGSHADGLHARMVREAQAMARLAHPNVLAVYDVGTIGSSVFVAMELVNGDTLTKWLETPRSRREIMRVFDQAGRGLAAAHAAGLVHRDFKPDNVMIGKDGRVRVMDFGLARQADSVADLVRDELPIAKRASALSMELTHAGAILGTPVYMAPEQWTGQPADARSDQYAFCVALWEALYGVRPFNATTIEELQTKVTRDPPDAPPPDVKLPRRVGGALRRGLEKVATARFPSVEALLDELAAEPLARRRAVFGLASVGLVGAGVLAASLVSRKDAAAPVVQPRDVTCDDAQVQLAQVWDAPRKSAVHAAMLATKAPAAAQTWTMLEHQLDARAADYMRVFAPTCHGEYHVAQQLQFAQAACLGRMKSQLAGFTSVLSDIKAGELDGIVQASWRLDSAARCEDATALATKIPPPSNAKLAVEVEALRQSLEKAYSINLAGRAKQALELASDVLARAEKTGYAAVIGQSQMLVGALSVQLGDAKTGEALLTSAYTTLLAEGDDQTAAKAALRLAKLIGFERQRPEAARQWMDQAAALIKRIGSPTEIELERLSAAGMIHYMTGDSDGARPFFEKAVEIGEKSLPANDPRRATQLGNLAGVLLDKGDLEGAVVMSKKALAISKQALGPEHPDVAMDLQNLGLILADLGKLDEAEADEREALALREKLLGPDHPDIVISLINLGGVLFKQNKFAEARDTALRSLELSRKIHGDDHPDTIDSKENLADTYDHLNEVAKAKALYLEVLASRKKILEPGHPDIKRAEDDLKKLKAHHPRGK
jgi:tetratricopeptide (TPR) repeat protein